MQIENIGVFGMVEALRGMRNPLNSWHKADSTVVFSPENGGVVSVDIGPNDRKLCAALCRGGQPHRKFLRQISVTMDITAPTYWWAEMDTYKVGTTRNSCSVQHKGASRDLTEEDFTFDRLEQYPKDEQFLLADDVGEIIDIVNRWRQKYVETKDYKYFRLMRQFLPMGYNYRATWSGTYETLRNIWEWRHNHKLNEWHELCRVIERLPGMDIFLPLNDETNGEESK